MITVHNRAVGYLLDNTLQIVTVYIQLNHCSRIFFQLHHQTAFKFNQAIYINCSAIRADRRLAIDVCPKNFVNY